MKKGKVFIILILFCLIGIEAYFFFNKEENKKNNNISVPILENINEEDKKYIADLFTGYKKNALEYKDVKDSNVSYQTISGLKDKEIENKINKEIKEKIYSIKDTLKNSSKYKIYTNVLGSFENVLSIEFLAEGDFSNNKDEFGYFYTYDKRLGGTLNYDLNTGNELLLNDVILSKSNLKTELVNLATEDINKNIGFVCGGGPCENPEPDYGKVEDGVLSVVNQYNKDNYLFTFTEEGVYLYFKDVYVPYPMEKYEDEEGYEECKVYKTSDDELFGTRYICQDNYETWYKTFINFYKVSDSVIVYDKFKSDDNIFLKVPEKVNRKFVKTNIGDDFFMYEVMEESDKQLVDYNLSYMYIEKDNELLDRIKEKVIKESTELNTNNFNIYNINGNILPLYNDKYFYVYFNVSHYDLDKSVYLENKKQIYLDKYVKYKYPEFSYEADYNLEYDYLKDYLTKKSYYFYIFDYEGNEYNTKDMLNSEFNLNAYIPDSWIKDGKYKTKESLVNSAILILSDTDLFYDRLVIYDDYSKLYLKYNGKSVELGGDYFETQNIKNQMFK